MGATVNGINPFILVAGVTLVIWLGIFLFLLRLESKIRELNR